MTALELRGFTQDYCVEYHWHQSDAGEVCHYHVPICALQGFMDMLGYGIVSEGGLEARAMQTSVCFEMVDICDHFGLDAKEILDPENER